MLGFIDLKILERKEEERKKWLTLKFYLLISEAFQFFLLRSLKAFPTKIKSNKSIN